jgi:hypothetical protein
MKMHPASELRGVQLELSSNCQAGCMECGRWKSWGDKQILNPNLKFGPAGNISADLIKDVFDRKKLPVFDFIALDGNYGDSLIHPQSLEIVEYLLLVFGDKNNPYKKTPKALGLEVNTNGGYHNSDYWYELGKLFRKHRDLNGSEDSSVVFGIDGVDNETHDKYRRNVVYDKVLENAKAFIDGGGEAEWKYLEFDHNVHQTGQAKEIARQLGFKKFFVKRSRWIEAALREVVDKDKSATKITGEALGKKPRAEYSRIPAVKKEAVLENIKKQVSHYKDYYNESLITCYWRAKRMLQIEYDGAVWQCCHLSGIYGSGTAYKGNVWEKTKQNEYSYYVDKYGTDFNNLNKHSLQEILEHPYFDSLENSWNNKTTDTIEPRLKRCVEKCAFRGTRDKREKL